MTTISRFLKRLVPPVVACACGALATLLLIRLGVAHAAAQLATAPPVAAAPAGIDWGFWLGAAGAALAAVSLFLHWIAPRTKATWDDKLRDDIDAVLAFKRSLDPKPALAVAPPPRDSQAGRAHIAMLVMVALIGCAATAATVKTEATTAEHAVINCTGQAIGQTPGLDLDTLAAVARIASVEKARCTLNGVLDWHCVETDAISEGKVLGGCALVQLIASAVTGAKIAPANAAAIAPGPDPGRTALEDFRAKVAGGATFHTASGDI